MFDKVLVAIDNSEIRSNFFEQAIPQCEVKMVMAGAT
jgi:hypothetical protein